MELIPAIDLLAGRVVRLSRGAYGEVTEYGDDPLEVARRWQAQGATRLHLVDLDGAREGRPVQAAAIASVIAAIDVPCQAAGGIRTELHVEQALAHGADRVVLGSAFIVEPALPGRLVARHGPDHVVAALDVRDGRALGDGWVASARGADAMTLGRALAEAGVRWFAVTAIARDGLMGGPDLALLAEARSALSGCSIIASGGVGSLADIRALAEAGYDAAILGRALYEGAFTLSEALAAAFDPAGPSRD